MAEKPNRLTTEQLDVAHGALFISAKHRELLVQWELNFMDEFARKFNKYGDKTYLSKDAFSKLQRIASKKP